MEQNLPTHIAIIPDGNRRWAKSQNLPTFEGHRRGFDAMFKLLKHSKKLGIKCFTLWMFSTENWKRDQFEINYLMDLAIKRVASIGKDLVKEKIRFVHLGRKDRIPAKLAKAFIELEEKTKDFTEYTLNIALDYGGRDEITTMVKNIVKEGLSVAEITEETISNHLFTKHSPDPDLIIRTSGEQRLSGFMPWQMAYSELYFADFHCPEFTPSKLDAIIATYTGRERRFGGNNK
jgi:undecaprenyl diphosphate synthase